MSLPLGLRLSNPGNIRHGQPWLGLTSPQTDLEFCSFVAPIYGIRAMAKILHSYLINGFNTIDEIINRWAPPADNNDTESYIKAVCSQTGLDRNAVITAADFPKLVPAIIHQEQGQQPYTPEIISNGIALALGG